MRSRAAAPFPSSNTSSGFIASNVSRPPKPPDASTPPPPPSQCWPKSRTWTSRFRNPIFAWMSSALRAPADRTCRRMRPLSASRTCRRAWWWPARTSVRSCRTSCGPCPSCVPAFTNGRREAAHRAGRHPPFADRKRRAFREDPDLQLSAESGHGPSHRRIDLQSAGGHGRRHRRIH